MAQGSVARPRGEEQAVHFRELALGLRDSARVSLSVKNPSLKLDLKPGAAGEIFTRGEGVLWYSLWKSRRFISWRHWRLWNWSFVHPWALTKRWNNFTQPRIMHTHITSWVQPWFTRRQYHSDQSRVTLWISPLVICVDRCTQHSSVMLTSLGWQSVD